MMTPEQELHQMWVNLGDLESPITTSSVKRKNLVQDRGNINFAKISRTIAEDPDFHNQEDNDVR